MRSTVTGGTRKQSCIDTSITRIEFHSSTINPFTDTLMKEKTYAFDLSELPVLTAFLKLDPVDTSEQGKFATSCLKHKANLFIIAKEETNETE